MKDAWLQVVATMYDPTLGGINGNPNGGACGVPIKRITWGLAHKALPCGAVVSIKPSTANGPILTVPVVDRGPYSWHGVTRGFNDVDLLPAVAKALGLPGKATIDIDIATGAKISVSKFANNGGDAAAFEKTSGLVSGVKGNQSTSAPHAPSDDMGTPANAGAAATNVVKDTVNGIGDFLQWVTSSSTWFRIGKGALGFTFIVVGTTAMVYIIGNQARGSAVGRAIKG